MLIWIKLFQVDPNDIPQQEPLLLLRPLTRTRTTQSLCLLLDWIVASNSLMETPVTLVLVRAQTECTQLLQLHNASLEPLDKN